MTHNSHSKLLGVLASFVLLFSTTGKIARTQEVTTGQQLAAILSEARKKESAGDFDGAEKTYRDYLAKLPKLDSPLDVRRSRVHYSIAKIHVARDKKTEAYAELRKAIDFGMWRAELLTRDLALASIQKTKEFAEIVEFAKNGPARMAFGRKGLDGKVIPAKDYDNKVIILDVWGTWCPPCREEIPLFVELQEKYGKHGLRVIGVTYEKTEPTPALVKQVKKFTELYSVNYPCTLIGRALINNIPVRRYPTTLIIDHEGKIAKKFIGKQTLFTLETEVVNLLNKKIVADQKAKQEADAKKAADAKKNAGGSGE